MKLKTKSPEQCHKPAEACRNENINRQERNHNG
jgi:hypothetical protein